MSALTSSDQRTCDLCQSTSFEPISNRDRRGQPLQTVLCRNCGLIGHASIPSEEELASFYTQRYRQDYHGESAPSDRRVMRAWNSAERIFGRLRDRVDERSRVVEIGAGIGCTVKRFANSGCKAWGIEPHVGFCEYGRNELAAPVENLYLSGVAASNDHDLALLIHVIEHFSSPLRSLKAIRDMLSPGGLLYIECPNLSAPFARRKKMFHFAHIHTFSPLTLTAIAARSGFELVHTFAGPRYPNLEMLFQRNDNAIVEFDKRSYRESKLALLRASEFLYHLRWSYLKQRAERLCGYASEYMRSQDYVARLRKSCG